MKEKFLLRTLKDANMLHNIILIRCKNNAVAVGMAPVSKLIFSMGTAVYSACLLMKKQFSKKLQRLILPYLFISQLQIPGLTMYFHTFSVYFYRRGCFNLDCKVKVFRSHYREKSNTKLIANN